MSVGVMAFTVLSIGAVIMGLGVVTLTVLAVAGQPAFVLSRTAALVSGK